MTKPTKQTPSKAGSATSKKAASGSAKAAKSVPVSKKATSADSKASPATSPAKATAKRPPNRAQSKKIVNQRQTPWGLVAIAAVIVVLAVGIVAYAVNKGGSKNSAGVKLPAAGDAATIQGISHKQFSGGVHKQGAITYDESPPMGGPHAYVWADCTGTVYPNQIASENAVHSLEHGAVWITYKPDLAADQVDTLSKLVAGQQFMLMSPYPGLKSNISLQAWGYQLFVDSASDPRITQFIADTRLNQKTTPELGASCENPGFKTKPSVPGSPQEQ